MTAKDRREAVKKLEYIIEMTTFEELYHDGINLDIRDLAKDAIEILEGRNKKYE